MYGDFDDGVDGGLTPMSLVPTAMLLDFEPSKAENGISSTVEPKWDSILFSSSRTITKVYWYYENEEFAVADGAARLQRQQTAMYQERKLPPLQNMEKIIRNCKTLRC